MDNDLQNLRRHLPHVRRLVVKIGSSLLTSARGLNLVMVHRLADQIAELHEEHRDVLVVSSGAVASGVKKIGMAEKPKTIPGKQAAAAVGQSVLMKGWESAFEKFDINVAQVLLTSEGLVARHRYLNARHTLETLLEWRIVPIINENDTVVVEEIKFGDNDRLSAEIAGLVGADIVINLTDTSGLYDRDPRQDPEARFIPVVHRVDRQLLAGASGTGGPTGTGGMLSKLVAGRKCLALGIPMIIAPGRERDILLRLLSGEGLGTYFHPQKRLYHGKKIWLANLNRPAGDLILDDGACRALRKSGKSLLSIGIREVRGTFKPGAPVRCVTIDGELIGVGLSNYHSHEIDRIKGHHSEEIESLLGYCHSEEVIHRDNFVLSEDIRDADSEAPALLNQNHHGSI